MINFLNSINFKIHKSVKYQFYIFSSVLIITLIYSVYFPIPAQDGTFVGIGSPLLNIGDRHFYINSESLDLGYGDIRGSFLYPLILKIITKFTDLFAYDNTSKVWNIFVISFSCFFSLLSLLLIDRISFRVFGNKVAFISNWLYIMCPYSLFYAINGSLTMYMIFGVSLVTFILTKSSIYINKNQQGISPFNTFLSLSFPLTFLSSLRPTGAIFSIVLITLLVFHCFCFRKEKIVFEDNIQKNIVFLILFFICFYSFSQLYLAYNYLIYSLGNFTNEPGKFFGVDRDLIRSRINGKYDDFFTIFKLKIYWIIWKTTEFVSGISDIRDSHSGIDDIPILPFFIRIFTGIFIVLPINLFAFIGLFAGWNRIVKSGMIWIFISIVISISPSFLGVAFTRYLFMFYPPIIIISASCIGKLFEKNLDSKKLV